MLPCPLCIFSELTGCRFAQPFARSDTRCVQGLRDVVPSAASSDGYQKARAISVFVNVHQAMFKLICV